MPMLLCRWSLNGSPTHDWGKFMTTKRKELRRLNDIHSNMLEKVSTKSSFAICLCPLHALFQPAH